MSIKHFQTATRKHISDAVETGLNAMFKELQDRMNVEDGGVAGVYDMGDDADWIREQLDEYLTGYVELERFYAPDEPIDAPMAPESYGSPYNDPNFLDAARTVEAHHAYMLTMGFGLDGSNDYGLFNLKAGSPDEMVAKLSITVPNVYTHTMTVEFAPGSPDVVHIDLQPLDEVQITLDDE